MVQGKSKPGKSAPTGANPTAPNSQTFQSPTSVSKAAIARRIFTEIALTEPRRNVLARFMNEAHLTAAGAATYYQNMKRDAGLVNARVASVPHMHK